MSLTRKDIDEIKLLARDVALEVTKEVLIVHIQGCPHGQAFNKNKAFLVGVVVGVGLFCGGAGFGIAKVLGI